MSATRDDKATEILRKMHHLIAAVPCDDSTGESHPCTLVSLDASGFPSARSMKPRAISEDLSEIRLETKEGTQKVAEIAANPKVAVHFHDQRGRQGWLTCKGVATLENARDDGMIKITIAVCCLNAVSYNETGLMADDMGWVPTELRRNERNDGWLVVAGGS